MRNWRHPVVEYIVRALGVLEQSLQPVLDIVELSMDALRFVALSFLCLSFSSAAPVSQQGLSYPDSELLAAQEQVPEEDVTNNIPNSNGHTQRKSHSGHGKSPVQGLLVSSHKKSSKRKNILNKSDAPAVSSPIFGGTHSTTKHSQNEIITNTLDSTCPDNWDAPWQVGLMFLTTDNKASLCGGVLVHRRWVLTAAHCLDNVTRALVMLGSKNYYDGFLNGKGQVISVENFTIHENYRRGTASQPALHDIALLRLESDAEFGPNVSPAYIPKRNSALLTSGTEMIVSGWGITEKSPTTQEQLQCARVPFVSHQVCEMAYKDVGVNIRTSHVCAGYAAGGAGPCNGDSGGGLVHRGSNGKNTVIGIISWSPDCDSNYSVYASVQKHRPWLFTNAPELAVESN